MIPDWMKNTDSYVPPKDGGTFVVKSIKSIGKAMAKVKLQQGKEGEVILPVWLKLILLIVLIVMLSISKKTMILLAFAAIIELYVCFQPPKMILQILKGPSAAGVLAFILVIPAMLIHPEGAANNLRLVAKVFLSIEMVSIFSHTTQWNRITDGLRKLHIPGVFVFTIDISLKYIVLLGTLINDLLTSLQLRSVGKNHRKYQSIGGVMGVTFLRSTEMSQEMYEAMQCRGFTDDYKGL